MVITVPTPTTITISAASNERSRILERDNGAAGFAFAALNRADNTAIGASDSPAAITAAARTESAS